MGYGSGVKLVESSGFTNNVTFESQQPSVWTRRALLKSAVTFVRVVSRARKTSGFSRSQPDSATC